MCQPLGDALLMDMTLSRFCEPSSLAWPDAVLRRHGPDQRAQISPSRRRIPVEVLGEGSALDSQAGIAIQANTFSRPVLTADNHGLGIDH